MPARLTEILAGLESLIVNDDRAAEHERIVREAQEMDSKRQRAERLAKQDLELTSDVHPKVIANAGMIQGVSLRAVQRWLSRPDLKPTLIIVGIPGCGKSVACAWAVANFSGSSAWYSAKEVVRVFSQHFGDAASKARTRAQRAQLTVIDDVSTEDDPVRMCSSLVEILESRKQRRTLITTNQTQEDWEKRFPDVRLHSRLAQQAIFVADPGPDLRVQKV